MPTHGGDAVDLEAMSALERYKFLTATVVPRPIALVTTMNAEGLVNAAPFSQFIILSASPAILGIVSGRHPDGTKDTHSNILTRREYVINIVSEDMAQLTQDCAFPFRPEIGEPAHLRIATAPSRIVSVPAIADSPVAFECRLSRTENFGDTATLIAGVVVAVSCRPGLVQGHRVDHAALRPLGRIAGRAYCRTGDVITMAEACDAPFSGLARG
ncbi:MAG: flavin reductase family protein [Rhodobacteraceae bacterium]|nr:flavin reductase family protein [Paracoccaceae bacterium]